MNASVHEYKLVTPVDGELTHTERVLTGPEFAFEFTKRLEYLYEVNPNMSPGVKEYFTQQRLIEIQDRHNYSLADLHTMADGYDERNS